MRRFKFKAAQRFRVVVTEGEHTVSFYTTDRQVRAGVGDRIIFNSAVRLTRDVLQHDIAKATRLREAGYPKLIPCGLAHRANGFNIQMDVL